MGRGGRAAESAPRAARARGADPPARDRAPRGVGGREPQVRSPARRRRARGGRVHAGRFGPRHGQRVRRRARGGHGRSEGRRQTAAVDVHTRSGPLHRLPLLADRLRRGLRLLRDGPARRREESHGRRDPRAALRRRGRRRPRGGGRGTARRLHGNGGAVLESRGRAPGARDSLRDHLAAARDGLDRGRDSGLRAIRGAREAAESRRVVERRRRGDADAPHADHPDLFAGRSRRRDATVAARVAPPPHGGVRPDRRRQRLRGGCEEAPAVADAASKTNSR